MCPEDEKCVYVLVTAGNFYSRGGEHVSKNQIKKTKAEYFIATHQDQTDTGLPLDIKAKVIGTVK